MYGEQGVKAVYKKEHLVKLRGTGCSIFFSSAKATTYLATKGYKVLYGTYLAAQQNITNLYSSGLC